VQDAVFSTYSQDLLLKLFIKLRCCVKMVHDPDGLLEGDRHTVLVHCDIPLDAADVALAVVKGCEFAGILGGPIEIDHSSLE
jgi:hypothetical protein